MNEVKFNCPHCNELLESPEKFLGKIINCHSCNGAIQLPSANHLVQQPSQLGKTLNQTADKPKVKGGSKLQDVCNNIIAAWSLLCMVCYVFGMIRYQHRVEDVDIFTLACGMGSVFIIWGIVVFPLIIIRFWGERRTTDR